MVIFRGDRSQRPPRGVAGGKPGRGSRFVLNPGTPEEKEMPITTRVDLDAGETMMMEAAGGGGYGEVGPPGYGGRDGYGQDYTRALPPPPPGRSTYVEVGAGIIRPPGERGNAPPPRKVGNCFDWQRGICTRGEGCKFSHGEHFDGGSQYSRDPPPPRRENPTWDGTRLY